MRSFSLDSPVIEEKKFILILLISKFITYQRFKETHSESSSSQEDGVDSNEDDVFEPEESETDDSGSEENDENISRNSQEASTAQGSIQNPRKKSVKKKKSNGKKQLTKVNKKRGNSGKPKVPKDLFKKQIQSNLMKSVFMNVQDILEKKKKTRIRFK